MYPFARSGDFSILGTSASKIFTRVCERSHTVIARYLNVIIIRSKVSAEKLCKFNYRSSSVSCDSSEGGERAKERREQDRETRESRKENRAEGKYERVSRFHRNRVRRVAPGESRIKSAFAGLMDRRPLNQISITTCSLCI